jgi:S1-C subfamily serine protease
VPIDVVKRSVGQLREEGRARYAYLGVTSVPLYPQLVEHFKLSAERGAWLQAIEPGGPAANAGLRGGSGREVFQGSTFARGGDVITKVGDTEIKDADDLSSAIARFKPGETADVEIHRGGETRVVKVKLSERPAATG